MDAQEYKLLHEKYMQNNNGSTITDTFVAIVPSFFTTFITVNILVVSKPLELPAQFLVEFLLNIFFVILNVTVLHVELWEITGSLFVIAASATVRQLYKLTYLTPFIQIRTKRPGYLAMTRSTINLLTAICILAVDFRCFPRSLAKTETFGFGLMDTGVGLFVYSNAIISSEIKPITRQKLTLNKLKGLLVQNSPLLALGMMRFFVINELDYQQHVSEYGVHWNFFLTLAATKIVGTIILSIISTAEHIKYVAILLLVVHETALQLGLSNYVLSDVPRTSFVAANREGLLSINGYVALYMASILVGSFLKTDATVVNARTLFKQAGKLAMFSILLWKLTYLCRDMFGVSRRLANMGYVVWILSIGTTMTALYMLLEIFYHYLVFHKPATSDEDTPESRTCVPVILQAIEYNGLAFFLAANILTGLINMTFQTLLVGCGGAVFLLTVYMFVLAAITLFLFVNKIKLKFW
ncbi:uncharacterized protein At4g17910-like [Bradysia coprophila]|uniref:uncharacterized protein At4g17910-like n=1 Tax=Bradysia coprophila TaxID=38358 RepID=UPI00187D9635|nr:uncharacterized protein At4g17910-like [Bradysia coprophila]